jgi:hypothetical protein
MLLESFPSFLLDLEPEVLRHALLDAAGQDGGGVDALDVGGLVGGEQGHAFVG